MKKLLTFISAAIVFAFAANAQNSDLIISKYFEGLNNSKCIEIYNGTGAPVDLSAYYITKEVNGAGGLKNPFYLSGTLAAGATYVVFNDQSNNYLIPLFTADTLESSNVMNFNGNDAVGLNKNGENIDVVGVLGNTDDWGKDCFMERKCSVTSPTKDYNSADWDIEQTTDVEYVASKLGSHCGVDLNPPTLKSAVAATATSIVVNFSEDLTDTTAQTVANYTVNNGITVSAATLTSARVVTLTVSTMTPGNNDTLTVTGVTDHANNAMTASKIAIYNPVLTDVENIKDMQTTFMTDVNGATNGAVDASGNFIGTRIFTLTNPVAVTALGSNTSRNQKWVEDLSLDGAAVLIDDPNKKITSTLTVGNTVTSLKGTCSMYYGVIEFIPTANVTADASPAFTVSPMEVYFDSFATASGQEYLAQNMSRLVTLNNVYFATNGALANGTPYGISSVPNGEGDAVVDSTIYTFIYNIAHTANKTEKVSITGLLYTYKGNMTIIPRTTADIVGEGAPGATEDLSDVERPVLFYKNGYLFIENVANGEKVEVYDILGRRILLFVFDGSAINLNNNLEKGIYIVKVGKAALKIIHR
jgi:hypothetical protein